MASYTAKGGSHLSYTKSMPLKAVGCVRNGQLYPTQVWYKVVRSCQHRLGVHNSPETAADCIRCMERVYHLPSMSQGRVRGVVREVELR